MRGLEYLHPQARALAVKLQALCSAQGLPLLITDTMRTKAEQDALYAKGRTVPGTIVTNVKHPDSAHNWGVAFDFCKNVKGQEYSDTAFFKAVGAIARTIGLTWGGDWTTFKDMPHCEVADFMPNSNTTWLKSKYGTPEAFKATWTHGVAVDAKAVIQARCKFDDPEAVWRMMDIHPYAADLYTKWANSYN